MRQANHNRQQADKKLDPQAASLTGASGPGRTETPEPFSDFHGVVRGQALGTLYRLAVHQRLESTQGEHLPIISWTNLKYRELKIFGHLPKTQCLEAETGRTELFTRELYHTLRRLHQVDSNIVGQIASKTKEPTIGHALSSFGLARGVNGTSLDEFRDHFHPRDVIRAYTMPAFMRPIILLRLIEGNPDVLEKLGEDSAYFPERLFSDPTTKMTKIERFALLDRAFAGEMLSIVTPELAEQIGKIRDYTEFYSGRGAPSKMKERLGNYCLHNRALVFWNQTDQEAIGALDELCSDRNTKREVYLALSQAMTVKNLAMHRAGAHSFDEKMDSQSVFRLNGSQFRITTASVRKFAKNQLLYAWQQHATGDFTPRRPLARAIDLQVIEADSTKLVVQDHAGAKQTFRRDSKMLNTTRELPLCMALLNRFYERAVEICDEHT